MSQKPLQIFFSENPFKKRKISLKSNDNVPIIEQNLIIHHKRNLRKSLAHKPKQYFDNEQKQKEPKENLNKNNNEINKNEAIINTGKRLIKFDNNLLIKKEDLLDENERREYEEKKKINEANINKGESFNPFGFVVNDFLKKNQQKSDTSNNNSTSLNPFKNINYKPSIIINNPFKLPDQDKINKSNPFMNLVQDNKSNFDNNFVANPFKIIKNKENNISPFSMNNNDNKIQNNPFLIINDEKSNNPFLNNNDVKSNNPFLNYNNEKTNNPFLNNNNEKDNNPFLNNNFDSKNSHPKNPFLNNDSSNIFTFNSNNLKHESDENPCKIINDEDEENIEEEIKIEKDENKLKNLKEVQYQTNNKFYQTEIENLQFLEQENGKNKYTSKGSGLFSFELTKNEKGKNVGIFTLREISTKHIKLNGIIINSTSVEKSKLKNGLEFIFIKNILVKYIKYESLSEQTKITFLRIRVKKEEIDNFYNKTYEFFNLVKK